MSGGEKSRPREMQSVSHQIEHEGRVSERNKKEHTCQCEGETVIGSPGGSAREKLWYAQAAEDEDPMPALKRTKRNQAQLDPVPMPPPQRVKIAIWQSARRSAPKLP